MKYDARACHFNMDTVVGENSKVNCVITDKNVSIRSSAELSGAETFPVCLVKNTKV